MNITSTPIVAHDEIKIQERMILKNNNAFQIPTKSLLFNAFFEMDKIREPHLPPGAFERNPPFFYFTASKKRCNNSLQCQFPGILFQIPPSRQENKVYKGITEHFPSGKRIREKHCQPFLHPLKIPHDANVQEASLTEYLKP
ncbi:MAG: hypothetical protein GY765_40545 [bacterium]|nr:hypothetical protein [bacterium]